MDIDAIDRKVHELSKAPALKLNDRDVNDFSLMLMEWRQERAARGQDPDVLVDREHKSPSAEAEAKLAADKAAKAEADKQAEAKADKQQATDKALETERDNEGASQGPQS